MSITLVIVIITALISIAGFSTPHLARKFQFNPFQVYHRRGWHRVVTHAFLHADWTHLIINMIVLLSFGTAVERYFDELESGGIMGHPGLSFVILYFAAVVISTLTTLVKHRNNSWYNAVGASGGVSAVIFTSIFFDPWRNLYFFGVVPIPGILFGAGYLVYSHYMSRKGADNINHDAHFTGAVFGLLFPLFIDIGLVSHFVGRLLNF